MTSPSSSGTLAPGGPPPGGAPRRFRRRRIVIDARYQMRGGLLLGATALVLLALLNASVVAYSRTEAIASGAAAQLAWSGAGADRTTWAILLIGLAVFLGGVLLVGLFESHRTAGAAYAIRRSIDAIREGRTGERVRLRKNDHLQELADAVNRLAESIDAKPERKG